MLGRICRENPKFADLRALETTIVFRIKSKIEGTPFLPPKGLPSGFADPKFPNSFKVGENLTPNMKRNKPLRNEILETTKCYMNKSPHDKDPGMKVPEPILNSIKYYQNISGKNIYRKGLLKNPTSGKSATRPHLYQENSHHYISHHPGHKQLWRKYSEGGMVNDSEEEDGDEIKEGEEDSEAGGEASDNESEEKGKSERETPLKAIGPSSNRGGESQHPARPKAPPKKLKRFGQEKSSEGQ
jgi:hypothetical protein